MKIMLAEIQSLTPGQRELPGVDDSAVREFPAMLQRKLDEVPGKDQQVIDFNELLVVDDTVVKGHPRNPGNAVETVPADQGLIRVGHRLDGEPVNSPSAEVAANLRPDRAVLRAAINAAGAGSPNTGEILPASGSSLPPAAENRADLKPVAESIRGLLATPPGAIIPASAESGASLPLKPDLSMQGPPATPSVRAGLPGRDRADPAGQLTMDPRIAPAKTLAASPAAGSAGLRAAPDSSATMMTAPGGKATDLDALDNRLATRSVEISATRRDDVALAQEAERASARALSKPVSPPGLQTLGSPAMFLDRVAITPQQTPATAYAYDFADNAAPRNPVGPAAAQPGAQSPLAESVINDLPTLRSGDPAVAANAGAAQPMAASIAGPGVNQPAPVAQGNPLPPHLETLGLARASDPLELGQGLGDRVSWMVNHKQNSATIRLDPPLLGKLDVQIRVADEGTTISIQTQHLQTRDLVEASAVRLRDFLQESGFQNVSVDVSHRQDQQQARASTLPENAAEATDDGEEFADATTPAAGLVSSSDGANLVDTFV